MTAPVVVPKPPGLPAIKINPASQPGFQAVAADWGRNRRPVAVYVCSRATGYSRIDLRRCIAPFGALTIFAPMGVMEIKV